LEDINLNKMYDEDILKSILSLKIDQLTMHDNYGEMITTTPNIAHNGIALVLMDLEQDVNVSTVTFTPRWLAV
jgi:hypothetical protein